MFHKLSFENSAPELDGLHLPLALTPMQKKHRTIVVNVVCFENRGQSPVTLENLELSLIRTISNNPQRKMPIRSINYVFSITRPPKQ